MGDQLDRGLHEGVTSFRRRRTNGACCPVVELRQYTLHPGKRETLIDLFDREFVETQETVGISVLGQFRDLARPDRFVWLRGFQDMPARAQALQAFYGGPVWERFRDAANATMIDSDNVLLLRPAWRGSGFALKSRGRPATGARESPGLITATVYHPSVTDDEFIDFFRHTVQPEITKAGASILGCFVTESSPNNYPALPVREGERVFVSFALFENYAAHQFYAAALAGSLEWRSSVAPALAERLNEPGEELCLSPTARSRLHA